MRMSTYAVKKRTVKSTPKRRMVRSVSRIPVKWRITAVAMVMNRVLTMVTIAIPRVMRSEEKRKSCLCVLYTKLKTKVLRTATRGRVSSTVCICSAGSDSVRK